MNLISILLQKERIFWNRMYAMFKEFKGLQKYTFGPIFMLILVLIHYAHMGMHTLYECSLYVFNRAMYRANMMKLTETIYLSGIKK